MTRWQAAHFLTGLALVANGCGRGDENPTARDVAAPGRDRIASPTAPVSEPATLAERLRANNDILWVEVKYDDGSVYGWSQDRQIELGRRAVKLRQIRRLRWGPKAEVELSDGTRLEGQFEDLRHLVVVVGEASHPLDLRHAAEVIFTTSYVEAPTPAADKTIRSAYPDGSQLHRR
jgi:hypothetical protein